jgi:hypothetical protein
VEAGVGEIVVVLRTPWDRRTIDRLPEVRKALAVAIASGEASEP